MGRNWQRADEMTEAKEVTPEQVQIIKDHLSLVMSKVTPLNSLKFTNTLPDTTSHESPDSLKQYPLAYPTC